MFTSIPVFVGLEWLAPMIVASAIIELAFMFFFTIIRKAPFAYVIGSLLGFTLIFYGAMLNIQSILIVGSGLATGALLAWLAVYVGSLLARFGPLKKTF